MKRLNVLMCVALGACSKPSPIEEGVLASLVDPDSARIGEITEFVDYGKEMACVMVNAKNRMGGYTGEQAVIAAKDPGGKWSVLPMGNATEGLDCASFLRIVVKLTP